MEEQYFITTGSDLSLYGDSLGSTLEEVLELLKDCDMDDDLVVIKGTIVPITFTINVTLEEGKEND